MILQIISVIYRKIINYPPTIKYSLITDFINFHEL